MNVKDFSLEKYKAWLSSPDPYQRGIAVAVIWHLGVRESEVEDKVVHILKTDDNINIRRDAVRMLREIKDSKFLDVFIGLLTDEDWLVKGEAFLGIRALGIEYDCDDRIQRFIETEVHPFCRFCIETERI